MLHLYMGDGKGKTTAAIGLLVRAAGAGKKVVFAQFMKGRDSSELAVLCNIPGVVVLRNDKDLGWYDSNNEEQTKAYSEVHNKILDEIETFILNGQCDVLILDEATYPYNYGIIDKKRLEALIDNSPKEMEIVITGRNADMFFASRADYITNMEKLRHPYDQGVQARKGIEY